MRKSTLAITGELGIIVVKGQDGSEGMFFSVSVILNMKALTLGNLAARFQCGHQVNDTVSVASNAISWNSIDLVIRKVTTSSSFAWPARADETRLVFEGPAAQQQQTIDPQQFGTTEGFRLALEAIHKALTETQSVVRLIVPQTQGYIARSDIVPLRLLDCPLVTNVLVFARPLQYFDGRGCDIEVLQDVPKVFASSAGGMLLRTAGCTSPGALASLLADLDVELSDRLSFSWISMLETKRKTLALVEGGRRPPDRGGNGETVYKAAEALGIDMIVLDNPGHWLDGPRWGRWCREFIPVECTEQSDHVFTARVVDAIRAWGGNLDGLVTFCDHYQVPIAAAAMELGLPTYSPEIFNNITNKFELSVSEGRPTHRASTFEEAAHIVRENQLEFPLIIKPSLMGFQSEGVYRVGNLEEIDAGMQATDTERHGLEFVIEKYCDAPEVDANFVLCDGEVLFFEASDEFPKGADVNAQVTGSRLGTFLELGNILPSALPAKERAVIRDSLHQSLLREGLPDGIYHLEARVQNSTMEYTAQDNVLDLTQRPVPTEKEKQPLAWLLEINPRPPGIQAADAIKHTYGVDYWGLALLFPLQDRQRIRQLSHPFAQGSQYWCYMVFLPVEKGGICQSDDPCLELFSRRPDLRAHVSWWCTFWTKGQRVPDPSEGRNTWIAHINVFSRTSRAHALEIGETVRKVFRYSIV
ncbi:hypothetical protein EN45_084130 [Penicillium chrysogenum]|jgi:hypothetical protein|uniref:Pc21g22540 protein n=2 Tax=Penicillium chrysogenum species complex TaxID=254878 RepID=B6HNG2_PENRW|nr:hypothetical protein EN45_084130 [Penicillium chrysogenum]CAP97151.1 Pc21g22540 [Penicillium rubens Wisconsin 54-1255]